MTHSSGSGGAASGTSGFIGLQQSKKVVNKLLQNQNQVIQIQRANWNNIITTTCEWYKQRNNQSNFCTIL